ncbi:MAG: hydroxyphenylacetyl-CoA thioesterase PaaI [Woeseiaceae bacterium]|nr:hydroxyphenylacetyl-CoA thioesterase PaaI [Woeseiaceae bacterium]
MDRLQTARACAQAMFDDDRASQALGISFEVPAVGEVIASMRVRDDMLNGFDVCHGGLIFALADTAFAFACNAHNRQSVAASGNIDFLMPARGGDELSAHAREIHRGRRGGVFQVDVVNQRSELVAVFRGRSASRDVPLV